MEDNTQQTIIRLLREQRGLSQAKLGKQIGVTRSTICQYEKGNRSPDIGTLKVLADFFGVTVDALLGRAPQLKFPDVVKAIQGDEDFSTFAKKCGLTEIDLQKIYNQNYVPPVENIRQIANFSNNQNLINALWQSSKYPQAILSLNIQAESIDMKQSPIKHALGLNQSVGRQVVPQPKWINEEKAVGVVSTGQISTSSSTSDISLTEKEKRLLRAFSELVDEMQDYIIESTETLAAKQRELRGENATEKNVRRA